jgi:hypothetical protein
MRKGLKITGIVLLALLLLLLILPFAFHGKIKDLALNEAGKQLNAKIYMDDLSLSFFRNFPHASVTISDFGVEGINEFRGDTLADVKKLTVVVNIKSLFGNSYEINRIEIDKARIYAKVLEDGKANWDITKPDTAAVEETDTAAASPFRLSLERFAINETDVTYSDDQSGMYAFVRDLNLSLRGEIAQSGGGEVDLGSLANIENLKLLIGEIAYEDKKSPMTAALSKMNIDFQGSVSEALSKLKTAIDIEALSFSMEKIPYLTKASVNAVIDMDADLAANKYTFRDNQLTLNAIRANFAGFVQQIDTTAFDMDITLNTPGIDFKQILSLIPAIYAKDFESVKTDGKVTLSAMAKGRMEGEKLPAFDVKLNIADAMFQYPDLPSSVTGININAEAVNPGGVADLTVVNIPKFQFNMANNPFEANLLLKTPVSDPDFAFGAKGVIDFTKVQEVMPLEGMDLKGMLKADLEAKGRLSYVEEEDYEKFMVAGNLNLSDFIFKSDDLPYDVNVALANLIFTNKYVDLTTLQVLIGKNDIEAKGKLENFLPYIMKNETIKGQLSLNSSYFNVNDFVSAEDVPEQPAEETPMTVIRIPANIDFSMDVNFLKLIYDNIELDNSKGAVTVKDQILDIKNLSSHTLGGSLGMKGYYNVQDTLRPKVDMVFDVKEMVIAEVFSKIETANAFAPMLADAGGNFSMGLSFNSALGTDMMPVFETVNGKGKFTSKEVMIKNVKALDLLADKLNYTALKDPKIKDVAIAFAIENGRINTEPFSTKVAGANMTVSGSSGLDQTLDYKTTVSLPNDKAPNIPLSFDVLIGGTFTSPNVSVSVKNTLNAVTDQVKAEVKKVVDNAVQKAIETAKATQQKMMAEAQKQAEAIRTNAAKAGDKLVNEAQKQADAMVSGAKNAIEKVAKKKAGEALVKEAKDKSNKLKAEAEAQANSLISSVQQQTDKIVREAEAKVK